MPQAHGSPDAVMQQGESASWLLCYLLPSHFHTTFLRLLSKQAHPRPWLFSC